MVSIVNNSPTRIYLDEQAGIVFVCYGEQLNLEVGMEAARKVSELPELQPGFGTFIDFRNCVDIKFSAEDIRELNKYIHVQNDWRGTYPTAHLLSSKLLVGLSRMSAATYGPGSNQVGSFDKLAPALEWVGLPTDYELPF
jgi:hypothetical protein